MPRYLYHCPACRQTFEVEKPMSAAAAPAACPQCGQSGHRLFTPPGLGGRSEDSDFGESDFDSSGSSEPADGCASCAQNGACGMNGGFED